METIRLPRSGDAVLRFLGTLLAETKGEQHASHEQLRWHDLAVYVLGETEGAKYAVSIRYETRWQGETGQAEAWTCKDAAAVRALLRDHDPCAHVAGYPVHQPGGQVYQERQAKLVADIRARYQAQVQELLDRAEFDEAAGEDTSELYRRWQIAIYRQLLAIGLREVEWTEAEASLICDALNGTYLLDLGDEPHSWRWWPANVEDAIRLDKLDAKWGVDAAALVSKIKHLSATGLAAVADAAERFWREHVHEGTGPALVAVGLVREAKEPK